MRKYAPVFTSLLALALIGCASAPERRSPSELNSSYINAVEREAHRMGVDVQWVNPPRRARQWIEEESE